MSIMSENEMKWNTATPVARARAIAAEMNNVSDNTDDKNIHVGDKLYTYTDSKLWTIRMCHEPYTVTEVKGNMAKIRKAKLVFNGPRYFDTLPDAIVEDPSGEEKKLRWNPKQNRWQITPKRYDAEVAVFGKYDYQPYLD